MNSSFDQLLPTSTKQWWNKKNVRSQKQRGGKLRRNKRCFNITKECTRPIWRGNAGNSNKRNGQYRRSWRWKKQWNRNKEIKKKGRRRNSIKKCKWETIWKVKNKLSTNNIISSSWTIKTDSKMSMRIKQHRKTNKENKGCNNFSENNRKSLLNSKLINRKNAWEEPLTIRKPYGTILSIKWRKRNAVDQWRINSVEAITSRWQLTPWATNNTNKWKSSEGRSSSAGMMKI